MTAHALQRAGISSNDPAVWNYICELEAEVSDLKAALGYAAQDAAVGRFRSAFNLTDIQGNILWILHDRRGNLVRYAQVFTRLYCLKPSGGPFDSTLKVHVCHLRSRLAKKTDVQMIETVWGTGYQMTPAGILLCDSLLQGVGRSA